MSAERERKNNRMLIGIYAVTTISVLAVILIAASMTDAETVIPSICGFLVFQLILILILLRTKKDMTQQIREAEAQKAAIEELSKAQKQFFSNMSHEIRTPINTIIGFNEMILRENASEEINEDAENIQVASTMLLHLINDILDMSKMESGQMRLNEAPYQIGDMLTELVKVLRIRAREKNLAFLVDISPELPSVLYGDEVRIRQILINVLNNAIKYTSEGSVEFSVWCERDAEGKAIVSYSVKDTGMGIRRESIPYLFTAFKRVDEEKNRHIEGTGLGLSIVKQLVDLMDGKITVNSVYTKGSTFVIELPQRIINDEPVGVLDGKKKPEDSAGHVYKESFEAPEARVLVVDDTASNLLVVTKLLKKTGIQIDTAGSGEEALKRTQSEAYHVILMDHKMPGMDGVECLHAIRNQVGGLSHGAKIIALTANVGSGVAGMYAREGFDGYLMKPVTGDELESTLYRFLPKELVTVTGQMKTIEEESTAWLSTHIRKSAVKITTESIADIPKELSKKYNIGIIPHMVITEKGRFKDMLEIDSRGLVEYMEGYGEAIESRAPSEEEYESFFSRQLDEAGNIIHITTSQGIERGGYDAAQKAADGFGNVFIVDSGHLSASQGMMAIEAARLAEEGALPEAIIARMEEMRELVRSSFIVDTVDYLIKKNQVGEWVANVARANMVHPVIALRKGKLKVSRVYIGSRQRVWERYVASAFNVPGTIDRKMLFITYVGMTKNEIETVRAMAEKIVPFEEVFCQKASPALATNCGPGTFALMFCTTY
ncbi:MAG: DegV family EDD domain-containing protein [Lachnospiraceae bacterium]|nr:DegV family EDD domain-containing protein [Lachnospiraceae bacterium]